MDEKQDDDLDKKGPEVEVKGSSSSISGDSFDAVEEESELDPVALKKAFRFATWSSVGLVCPKRVPGIAFSLINVVPVRRSYLDHSSATVLLFAHLQCKGLDRLGGRWYCLDIFVSHFGRIVPSLREQARTRSNNQRTL